MKHPLLMTMALAAALSIPTEAAARVWDLNQCLAYAQEHNIRVQKNRLTEQTAQEDLKQKRAALWPSVSASINQGVNYHPFPESYTDASGLTYNVSKKAIYSGSYGINANWTLWNGGVNQNNIKAQEIQNQLYQLATEQSQLALQEQIAQLYVQIMYCQEATKVNETLLTTARKQYDRGVEMKRYGQIAKADLAQLEAQVAACEYNVVNSQTQVANFKRQLKALLELDMNEDFDLQGQTPADESVMQPIPAMQDIYAYAQANRPEMRTAELSQKAAEINEEIARGGMMPTISLGANVGDSHNTNGHGAQMKTNLNLSAGLTVSIPLWQQRRNITNVNKAKMQRIDAQLDLEDTRNTLSSTIEQYWLDATNGQHNFQAAQTRVESQQASYELLNEQFSNGLKNIVELLESRDQLVSAKQDMLQAKYTTLLNIQLLKLYGGDTINL